jgi:phenylacetic acid degradation operon negative regulatory protein
VSERPLTARSVVASLLLGTDPPRLPARLLARSGELFGISDGTTRVALSRMVAAGELTADDGEYALAGHLLVRRARQTASRAARVRKWSGDWLMAIVVADRRAAADRAALRRSLTARRLAELREGVWTRPDNIDVDRAGAHPTAVTWMTAQPDDPNAIVASAWDLREWAGRAAELRRRMRPLRARLERHDTEALADGFVLSASVLRHLQADPLLPDELLPRSWPGAALRADYDRYDKAYRAVLGDWLRRHR